MLLKKLERWWGENCCKCSGSHHNFRFKKQREKRRRRWSQLLVLLIAEVVVVVVSAPIKEMGMSLETSGHSWLLWMMMMMMITDSHTPREQKRIV